MKIKSLNVFKPKNILGNEVTEQYDIKLTDDIVNGSVRAYLTVIGESHVFVIICKIKYWLVFL